MKKVKKKFKPLWIHPGRIRKVRTKLFEECTILPSLYILLCYNTHVNDCERLTHHIYIRSWGLFYSWGTHTENVSTQSPARVRVRVRARVRSFTYKWINVNVFLSKFLFFLIKLNIHFQFLNCNQVPPIHIHY